MSVGSVVYANVFISLLQMVLTNLSAAKLQPNFIGIAGCFRDEQLPQILHYWSNFNLIRMESKKA